MAWSHSAKDTLLVQPHSLFEGRKNKSLLIHVLSTTFYVFPGEHSRTCLHYCRERVANIIKEERRKDFFSVVIAESEEKYQLFFKLQQKYERSLFIREQKYKREIETFET